LPVVPFLKRGLERVFGRSHQVGISFEIQAALLAHASMRVDGRSIIGETTSENPYVF
jgi:hypothetical protein